MKNKEWTKKQIDWLKIYYLPHPFERMLVEDIKKLEREHLRFFGFERSAEEIHAKWWELMQKTIMERRKIRAMIEVYAVC